MSYQVKELGLGGILDQAVALLKNRFGLLMGINMVLLVPFQVVSGLAILYMMPVMPNNPTATDIAEFQRQYIRVLPVLGSYLFLFFVVVAPLTNAAIAFAVANEYLERPVTIGVALRRTAQILLPLMGTGFLYYFAVFGGMALLFIPGILFAFWFALWAHIVVIEGIGGVKALQRSRFLMKGNIGTLFVLGLLVGLINTAAALISKIVPEPHVQPLVDAFVQGLIFSFAGAAYVVFYFSCRCKAENFDLTLLADSVAVE